MDVENILVPVRCVRQQVGAVGFSGAFVEVIVFLHQCDHLGRNLQDLLRWKVKLLELALGCLEITQKSQLLWEEEEQRSSAAGGATRSSPHSVDVVSWVIRGVELHDPVHRWNVQASGSNIGTQEDALLRLTKLEKSGGSLLLFLLSVDIKRLNVDIVEQLGVIFDRVAA